VLSTCYKNAVEAILGTPDLCRIFFTTHFVTVDKILRDVQRVDYEARFLRFQKRYRRWAGIATRLFNMKSNI